MDTQKPPSGDYQIGTPEGEIERLRIQDRVFSGITAALLDAIGVEDGWRCIDLGCGPEGLTAELSARVGAKGKVVGLDFNPVFIETARAGQAANTQFMVGDAYATGLPDGAFDLAHTRFLASTAGMPEALIAEAVRLVRAGGVVAMQEADFHTLRCFPPDPAWDRLRELFLNCFPRSDSDPVAQRLFRMLRASGLQDVGYRPCIVGVRTNDAWQDYLPATVTSLRGSIETRQGVSPTDLDDLLAACRAHLARPDTVFTSFTVVQVWGRKPVG